MYIGYMTTPIGNIELCADDVGITSLIFCEQLNKENKHPLIDQAKRELSEYFEGTRKVFEVPLHIITGTQFQRKCWKALCEIPYGETRSYYVQACMVKNPKAVRAVGGANHHNPISILIPCHRVIAKNGSLCGYGGGVLKKEFLLELEAGEEV